ncbi:transcription regulator HTH, apses-type DNA-binding domain-containing protein [Phycomyces nitens]|nr:transcription regulator HTH, apses-type DNA-binding domain-containing protein [Phycomyces nitens]
MTIHFVPILPAPPLSTKQPSKPAVNTLSSHLNQWSERPRFTTVEWVDECTLCYQVNVNGTCVTRRQDNDMINGTKLLNMANISRGKRDGILKFEKDRMVIRGGIIDFRGVWITFDRAKQLASQYSLTDTLYPLFEDFSARDLNEGSQTWDDGHSNAFDLELVPSNEYDAQSFVYDMVESEAFAQTDKPYRGKMVPHLSHQWLSEDPLPFHGQHSRAHFTYAFSFMNIPL